MALVTIKNDKLTVILDSTGAVFDSIVSGGNEYLWQGDEKYWTSKDHNLFPYVGRLTDGQYIYQGKKYPMSIHGFVKNAEFEIERQSAEDVTFIYSSNGKTREIFPFEFDFRVSYELCENKIIKKCSVENKGKNEMFFGLGSHPGFKVPVCGEGKFEDWVLEFDEASEPERVEIDMNTYRLAGTTVPYSLEDGRRIPLRHELFDGDAIILHGMPRAVSIKSDLSAHSVRVSFPDMPFVGFWHAVKTDAPYVCIEPWVSLPSHSAYMEDIEQQEHIIHLAPGKSYVNTVTVEIK